MLMPHQNATGRKYAVKSIGKAPKRSVATPRYLLKLRTEVEIMQQLGYSLDAVNLKDVFEDDESVHLVMEVRRGSKQWFPQFVHDLGRSWSCLSCRCAKEECFWSGLRGTDTARRSLCVLSAVS